MMTSRVGAMNLVSRSVLDQDTATVASAAVEVVEEVPGSAVDSTADVQFVPEVGNVTPDKASKNYCSEAEGVEVEGVDGQDLGEVVVTVARNGQVTITGVSAPADCGKSLQGLSDSEISEDGPAGGAASRSLLDSDGSEVPVDDVVSRVDEVEAQLSALQRMLEDINGRAKGIIERTSAALGATSTQGSRNRTVPVVTSSVSTTEDAAAEVLEKQEAAGKLSVSVPADVGGLPESSQEAPDSKMEGALQGAMVPIVAAQVEAGEHLGPNHNTLEESTSDVEERATAKMSDPRTLEEPEVVVLPTIDPVKSSLPAMASHNNGPLILEELASRWFVTPEQSPPTMVTLPSEMLEFFRTAGLVAAGQLGPKDQQEILQIWIGPIQKVKEAVEAAQDVVQESSLYQGLKWYLDNPLEPISLEERQDLAWRALRGRLSSEESDRVVRSEIGRLQSLVTRVVEATERQQQQLTAQTHQLYDGTVGEAARKVEETYTQGRQGVEDLQRRVQQRVSSTSAHLQSLVEQKVATARQVARDRVMSPVSSFNERMRSSAEQQVNQAREMTQRVKDQLDQELVTPFRAAMGSIGKVASNIKESLPSRWTSRGRGEGASERPSTTGSRASSPTDVARQAGIGLALGLTPREQSKLTAPVAERLRAAKKALRKAKELTGQDDGAPSSTSRPPWSSLEDSLSTVFQGARSGRPSQQMAAESFLSSASFQKLLRSPTVRRMVDRELTDLYLEQQSLMSTGSQETDSSGSPSLKDGENSQQVQDSLAGGPPVTPPPGPQVRAGPATTSPISLATPMLELLMSDGTDGVLSPRESPVAATGVPEPWDQEKTLSRSDIESSGSVRSQGDSETSRCAGTSAVDSQAVSLSSPGDDQVADSSTMEQLEISLGVASVPSHGSLITAGAVEMVVEGTGEAPGKEAESEAEAMADATKGPIGVQDGLRPGTSGAEEVADTSRRVNELEEEEGSPTTVVSVTQVVKLYSNLVVDIQSSDSDEGTAGPAPSTWTEEDIRGEEKEEGILSQSAERNLVALIEQININRNDLEALVPEQSLGIRPDEQTAVSSMVDDITAQEVVAEETDARVAADEVLADVSVAAMVRVYSNLCVDVPPAGRDKGRSSVRTPLMSSSSGGVEGEVPAEEADGENVPDEGLAVVSVADTVRVYSNLCVDNPRPAEDHQNRALEQDDEQPGSKIVSRETDNPNKWVLNAAEEEVVVMRDMGTLGEGLDVPAVVVANDVLPPEVPLPPPGKLLMVSRTNNLLSVGILDDGVSPVIPSSAATVSAVGDGIISDVELLPAKCQETAEPSSCDALTESWAPPSARECTRKVDDVLQVNTDVPGMVLGDSLASWPSTDPDVMNKGCMVLGTREGEMMLAAGQRGDLLPVSPRYEPVEALDLKEDLSLISEVLLSQARETFQQFESLKTSIDAMSTTTVGPGGSMLLEEPFGVSGGEFEEKTTVALVKDGVPGATASTSVGSGAILDERPLEGVQGASQMSSMDELMSEWEEVTAADPGKRQTEEWVGSVVGPFGVEGKGSAKDQAGEC